MKILLTGKTGQVGRELSVLLPRIGDVCSPNRRELDLANPDEIRESIRIIRPQLIVNAAAYTAVDQAESDPAMAQAINGDAPQIIAEEGKRIGASLVHYSTDYVFDGEKEAPYVEDDPPNPQNTYGATKLAGEQAIQESGIPHLIFRIAWVYAQEGRNFLLTVLRLAAEREELKIVCDQKGAPTWSRELAQTTIQILSRVCSAKNSISFSDSQRHLSHECRRRNNLGWFCRGDPGRDSERGPQYSLDCGRDRWADDNRTPRAAHLER